MNYRTCAFVMVGSDTANRKWINHEIVKSWHDNMGVVGIYINGLKNLNGDTSSKGESPFDCIGYGNIGKKLSQL